MGKLIFIKASTDETIPPEVKNSQEESPAAFNYGKTVEY